MLSAWFQTAVVQLQCDLVSCRDWTDHWSLRCLRRRADNHAKPMTKHPTASTHFQKSTTPQTFLHHNTQPSHLFHPKLKDDRRRCMFTKATLPLAPPSVAKRSHSLVVVLPSARISGLAVRCQKSRVSSIKLTTTWARDRTPEYMRFFHCFGNLFLGMSRRVDHQVRVMLLICFFQRLASATYSSSLSLFEVLGSMSRVILFGWRPQDIASLFKILGMPCQNRQWTSCTLVTAKRLHCWYGQAHLVGVHADEHMLAYIDKCLRLTASRYTPYTYQRQLLNRIGMWSISFFPDKAVIAIYLFCFYIPK